MFGMTKTDMLHLRKDGFQTIQKPLLQTSMPYDQGAFSLSQEQPLITPSTELTRPELKRYSRQLLVPEWHDAGAQEKIKAATVLVVGAGGLGGPVILQLAGAGVGRLVVSDGDHVELSNLHRQTHFTMADIGQSKAHVILARAQQINPFVQIKAKSAFTVDNAAHMIQEADLIIDATDNFETRYAIADACQSAQKRWIWGAASGTTGMVSVFSHKIGLRQIFPDPTYAQSCHEAGVLGPVPNITGGMMALEALKVLAGFSPTLEGRLWNFDALMGRSQIINLNPIISNLTEKQKKRQNTSQTPKIS